MRKLSTVQAARCLGVAESDAVTEAFLSSHPDWAGEPALRLAPDTDGTDGFYIAALRRS